MAKIKLGECPKTFKEFPVKFVLPNGDEAGVMVTFKYRTRTQFGEFQNSMFGDQSSADDRLPGGGIDFKKLYERVGAHHADHLLKAIESWDLDFLPTVESLAQMSNEIPASAAAFMSAYNAACTEGRLGN